MTAVNLNYYDAIRRPLVTEKASISMEAGKYSFEVSSCATKVLIKKAVEAIFKVNVTQVNISNVHGKRKIFKGCEGFRKGYKKAIVTLQQGQTIDFMSGV